MKRKRFALLLALSLLLTLAACASDAPQSENATPPVSDTPDVQTPDTPDTPETPETLAWLPFDAATLAAAFSQTPEDFAAAQGLTLAPSTVDGSLLAAPLDCGGQSWQLQLHAGEDGSIDSIALQRFWLASPPEEQAETLGAAMEQSDTAWQQAYDLALQVQTDWSALEPAEAARPALSYASGADFVAAAEADAASDRPTSLSTANTLNFGAWQVEEGLYVWGSLTATGAAAGEPFAQKSANLQLLFTPANPYENFSAAP